MFVSTTEYIIANLDVPIKTERDGTIDPRHLPTDFSEVYAAENNNCDLPEIKFECL